MKKILVATDFSQAGNNAVMAAITICKQQDAVLHLLHVVENQYIVGISEDGAASASVANNIEQHAREQIYNVYEAILRDHNIQVQIHMPTGIPAEEICKTAWEMPIDLIVLGKYGNSGTNDFRIGSTAYSVIRNAIKPVITIPPDFSVTDFKKIFFPVNHLNGIKEKYLLVASLLKDSTSIIHFALMYLYGEKENIPGLINELLNFIVNEKNKPFDFSMESNTYKDFASKILQLTQTNAFDLIVINNNLQQFHIHANDVVCQLVSHSKIPVLSLKEYADTNHNAKEIQEKGIMKGEGILPQTI